MKVAFWIALLGLAFPLYAYLIYPLVLFVLAALVQMGRDVSYLFRRRDRRSRTERTWSVTIIMAAYNEQEVIARTLENCISVDYPKDYLEVIVGSDGSDDDTLAIAQRYADAGVRVLDFKERRGKLAVIGDCAVRARGQLLVLTDANTMLRPDSVASLVRHFDDPQVGAVCGELRLSGSGGKPVDEGVYWRYEVVLKTLESRLNAVLGANGAIYAIRRGLFPRLPPDLITDDFVIPMTVRGQGYHVVYDPEAVAMEEAAESVAGEYRRRVRIGAGNWQALRLCARLLLPSKGWLAFAFWSHKVLRWFTPFMLVAGLCANLFLLEHPFWRLVLAVQAAFYGVSVVGTLVGRRAGPLRLPAYFTALNIALGVGMVRGMLGLQPAAWQRTSRESGHEGRDS